MVRPLDQGPYAVVQKNSKTTDNIRSAGYRIALAEPATFDVGIMICGYTVTQNNRKKKREMYVPEKNSTNVLRILWLLPRTIEKKKKIPRRF